jgi:hypothetical protein
MARSKYIYILIVKDEVKAAFTVKEELKYFIQDAKKLKEYKVLSVKDGGAWIYLKGGNITDITEKIKEELSDG